MGDMGGMSRCLSRRGLAAAVLLFTLLAPSALGAHVAQMTSREIAAARRGAPPRRGAGAAHSHSARRHPWRHHGRGLHQRRARARRALSALSGRPGPSQPVADHRSLAGCLPRQAGLLRRLARAGLHNGRVVDLGCGSGILARELALAGYDVLGVDSSPAMIELARTVAPEARFVVASLHDVELSDCVAITAIGEGLNYLPSDSEPRPLPELFERFARALRPGGLLLFDLIVRGSGRPMSYRSWAAGEDWTVLVEVEEEPAASLLRRGITTFRRIGPAWRRGHEEHRVRVFDRAEVEKALRATGFTVRTSRRWGDVPLGPRRLAFEARARQSLADQEPW